MRTSMPSLQYFLHATSLVVLVQSAQPSAPPPIAAPLRPLPWGQLNFLHTTDSHGWLGGHLQEPAYSADWGDYISFSQHLQRRADADGTDLLIIDTGDRIEGNGLYDGSEPKGRYIFDIFKQQHMDLICSGNHELYKQNSSENEYYKTVPNFRGKYLASNLKIFDKETNNFEPMASRYRVFTTKNQGIRIAAFGFLYNFMGNANNTVVQPVQEAIKEKWFQDAIREEVDLFVVIGHVGVKTEEVDAIYKAIRDVRWSTPIQFFGGHWHIRAYRRLDSAAYALASGRYMETVGFMSIDGISTGKRNTSVSRSPSFERRYIDHNLYSLQYHANTTNLSTEHGRSVSEMITHAREKLNLDMRYGCAPKDLWMNRVPFESENSMFTWLNDQVFPDELADQKNPQAPKIILANTGAMRFDIFKGPFTRDTTFLVSPFTSGFRQIRGVRYELATRLVQLLNGEDPIAANVNTELDLSFLTFPENTALKLAPSASNHLLTQAATEQMPLMTKPSLFPGYTTVDDDGEDGDDTVHSPIPSYVVPNCMETRLGEFEHLHKSSAVDVVYNEFLEPYIIIALKFLGTNYSLNDTSAYRDGRSLTDMISDWVQANWPCED